MHFEHFFRPKILVLKLSAVNVDNGGVYNLKSLAGCQQSYAFGVLCAVAHHVSGRSCVEVVHAVAVLISRERNEHDFACLDVAPDLIHLINGERESAFVAEPEQAESVLDACAVLHVVSSCPVVGALTVCALVLNQVVDHVLSNLYDGVVEVGYKVAVLIP